MNTPTIESLNEKLNPYGFQVQEKALNYYIVLHIETKLIFIPFAEPLSEIENILNKDLLDKISKIWIDFFHKKVRISLCRNVFSVTEFYIDGNVIKSVDYNEINELSNGRSSKKVEKFCSYDEAENYAKQLIEEKSIDSLDI